MKQTLKILISLSVVAILGACAHEDEAPKDLATDHFEVSAQGGDDKIVRNGGPIVEVINISGTLKVKGVNQKYMSGLAVQLIDRDATIYARAKTNSEGGFQLVGQIPYGLYLIRVVDKKFKGQLPVKYHGIDLRDLIVPVQPVIR
ncbi:hypothetical protein [Bdellovibrio sp. HCB209]|uniref:hypothetical protein n=1 Tax=Bdellovibrio sp. HCB209 TaxID=3394354 RepID=UPI0039B6990F